MTTSQKKVQEQLQFIAKKMSFPKKKSLKK